ncbi:MAG: cupin domain-containing protein [Planctomycetes bacterium]|nr:cupin domain-containing protein [Planctomycetota bacterium]
MNPANADAKGSLPDFNECLIEFSALPWDDIKPFVREKRVNRSGQVIRFVEFRQGFEEDGWCESGHVGYVTQGRLEVRFEDRSISVSEGDAIWIPAGSAYRHRATVVGEFVRLILFESDTPESP